jgi:hypothetical protein
MDLEGKEGIQGKEPHIRSVRSRRAGGCVWEAHEAERGGCGRRVQQAQTPLDLQCSVSGVGIDNPPVLKTDTQETENLDKAIFS